MSEVVLSNFVAKGIDKRVDGTLNVNFSDFGILPGLIETDVLQTIQALPGIQSADETVSNISVRGGSNDQNLILWDGIKMYQSGHFFGLISVFNPEATNNALIIKNGTDVDYSDGVSGTVVMKTDSKNNSNFKGSIGSNFLNTDIFIDLPIGGKSSVQIAGRKAISEFGETPTYKKYFERIKQDTDIENITDTDIKFDFHDASIRWLFDVTDKDQIRVNFLYINNELTFLEEEIFNSVEQTRESGLEQSSVAGGLFYKRKWNNKFTSTLQISETTYQLKAINSEVLTALRLEQVNKMEETSIKLNTWLQYNDQLSFLNGYQFTETAANNLTNLDDPRFTRLVREVIREHGLYSQINYTTASNNTFVKLGTRYSFIEKFKKHMLEPRLTINHKLSNTFSLELLGEFKHQNTSQIVNIQNDFFGIEKRRWYLSDEIKRPIVQSKQVSIGANFSDNNLLISFDGYYKNVRGISSQSQGFLNQYAFEEVIGSYDVLGIDFLLNKKFNKLSTWLSYSYANNDYTFNDFLEISFPNNIEISHSVTLGVSYSKNNLKIATGINWWQRGIPTTKPVRDNQIINGEINYEAANSSNLATYFRIDASATYQFKISKKIKAQTGLSIWNTFNNRNVISEYYNVGENNGVKTITKNALEFTPNFSFRVLF